MAPVGRSALSGKNPFSNNESCTQILREDEIKQEPSDEDVFHNGFLEVVPVKNKVTLLYGAMNNDEGVVIKQEDTSEDEEKPDVNALDDDIIAESDRRNYAANNPSLLDDVGDSSKLLCKVCGKQFFRVYYFNLHMKTHKSSSTTSHQDLEKPHKCHECGKSFAFLQHLTGHSRIHIAGQYYECPICRRKFTEFSNLSMHLLKTHPDEKPYKCSECGKQFTQSSALKKHFRTHSSHISQEELDRIDMMFFVSDDGRRDFEEPLKKKIKLEIEEDKISPHKEKSPTKDAVAQSKLKSPCKETFTSLKVKLSEKEKVSQPIERNLVKSHTAVSVKNEHEPVVEVAFKENETGLSLPLRLSPKFGVSPSAKEMSSKTLLSVHHESSVSFNNPAVATEPPSLDDSAVLSEDNSILFQSKAKSPKDSPIISHCKESLPLRNGVPLDQVKCPQIKVVKFPKAALESEPLSVKGQTFYSPLKSITGSNQTNFESVELMEETENSNQSIMCNGDRIQKGRPAPLFSLSRSKSDLFVGWERNKSDHRDPLPSLEEPEGEYEAKYKCHRCEIFLDSEEKLHDHLMDHTGVKLSECRFCGKDFTTLTSLKRHLYYHVAGLIPQDCLRCGKTFPTFKDLKEHCTSEECDASNSARYKCFRCRKEMPSLKKLKVHLLSQCNDEPAKFYFPKKNDSSLSPTSNVRAMDQNKSHEDISDSDRQVYSESDIKALKCDPKDEEALMILCEMEPEKGKECWNLECQTCGHKFENTVKAKVHTEVGCGLQSKSSDAQDKTEGDAYKIKVSFEEDENLQCFLNCAECGAKILGVEKMLLHIQEHIFEQNNLTCPVLKCGKLFKDPKEFKLHLKAHTGHKPFKCSDCGKRFFLRENYEHHAQRHGILKHWSSVSTIFGDNAGKKSIVARSPITIESSIINLEVSEADVERKAQSAQHQTAKALERIKEEVNEEVDDWQPRKKMKVPVSRSSTVNRQSLPFKRKTVPNFNKSSQPLKKPSHPPSKPTEPLIRPAQATNRLTQPVNKPSSPSNRPTSSVSALLSVSKPTPVNKPSSVSESSLPVHKSPTLLNQTSSIINRLSPPVVKSSPTLNRPLIPIIRASPSIEIPTTIVSRLPQSIGSPIVNRIISGHPASGSVSVTPQGIFTVSAPRTYLASSSGSCSKPSFSLSSNRTSLSQKDPNARVHPSSYYCITENSRASIQASNRELRKYPRSGVCEICKKICSRLDKHMMVHLNQKPHLCPVCPQAFRQSEHLRRHIRARHEGNHRQFECPQCEKRLTRKDKLKEHMKNCSRMLANSPLVTGPYLGDNLFNMIPGPAHLSHSNLQGHTTA